MSSKLGWKEFDANCEVVDAALCGVTDAECAAFGARIKRGEFKALTEIDLVRLFSFIWFRDVSALNLYRTTTKLETQALVL